MFNFKKVVLVSILIIGIINFWGCTTKYNEGTLKLNLSDATTEDKSIDGVYIKINEIQYHHEGEWKTFDEFEGPQNFNLRELTGGNFTLLGELSLPSGKYTQLRFMLDIPKQETAPTNPGCYIEFNDETTEPLFVPSGGESGYKAIGKFVVPVNDTIEVTAEFDIQKALVHTSSDRYILKPTIRVVVNNQAGNIIIPLTNDSGYSNIIVFAYQDKNWDESEDDDPFGEETRFPNSVTSGSVCEDGNYKLCFLAEGLYDIVVAAYSGETFETVLGFISDVEVISGKNTTIDAIATSEL
jgi:hypothetical protein